jgi:hypothetical protein
MHVTKKGYWDNDNNKATQTTIGLSENTDLKQDFRITPIPVEPIVLPEIFYDLAKWDLKPQYKDSLMYLYNIMVKNPTIVIGQNRAIKISGPANYYGYITYSVSSNSNPNVVGASIGNNNYITISGLSTGSSTISVCSSAGGCNSLYVTVNYASYNYNYYNYNYNSLSLSQTNLTLTMGQNANVTIFGAGNYYVSSNSSQNVASASINGNTLYVYGNNTGNTNISVCQYNGQCATLYVSVNFSNAYYNNYNYNYPNNYNYNYNYNYNQPISLSSNNIEINLGQTAYVSINGSGTGSYYVASNSNQGIAVVLAASNNVLIYGMRAGNTTASVCQSGGQCVNLDVSVNSNNGQTYPITCPICNCGNR